MVDKRADGFGTCFKIENTTWFTSSEDKFLNVEVPPKIGFYLIIPQTACL